MKGTGQDYKLEQHQNLVFMCHITEQHDYCHLGMFSTCENVFIHVYCSCLFTVKFSICSMVVLMVQGLHLCIRLGYGLWMYGYG